MPFISTDSNATSDADESDYGPVSKILAALDPFSWLSSKTKKNDTELLIEIVPQEQQQQEDGSSSSSSSSSGDEAKGEVVSNALFDATIESVPAAAASEDYQADQSAG